LALVYLSIGSNMDRYQRISASLDALTDIFGELSISSVYESEAVGFDGDNFLNLVVGFNCRQTVGELSQLLRQVEYDNGRRRVGPKFGPRTLDIDILTYDDCVGRCDGIDLPRDEISKNAFVLLPMAEIAAQTLHPVFNETYAELWQAYNQSSQKLWPVDFEWRGKVISKGIE
jgi:2-amino-4-hydroxy-6-hydroxymethyldihydropteridine diphosphokinase